nr:lipase family protein [Pontibacter silvestris]
MVKAKGVISSEKQFYGDVQTAYNVLKQKYAENLTVVTGHSVGTASAVMLAAKNQPRQPSFCKLHITITA